VKPEYLRWQLKWSRVLAKERPSTVLETWHMCEVKIPRKVGEYVQNAKIIMTRISGYRVRLSILSKIVAPVNALKGLCCYILQAIILIIVTCRTGSRD